MIPRRPMADGTLLNAEQSFRLGIIGAVDRDVLIASIVKGMHARQARLQEIRVSKTISKMSRKGSVKRSKAYRKPI